MQSSNIQIRRALVWEQLFLRLTRKALATDPVSAFGGIVAFNRTVDTAAAQEVTKIFTEVVIAPDYDPAALEILKTKKNLRVIRMASLESAQGLEYKQISGGLLVQTRDTHRLLEQDLKVVTERAPSDEELESFNVRLDGL